MATGIPIGFAAQSGLQTAQKVMDMIAHNIANSETPGYHRLEEHNRELGPFPVVGGVTTDIKRTENQMLDNLLNTAAQNKMNADTLADATKELDTLPADTLSTTYSQLMESSDRLMQFPSDPVAQEDFNGKVKLFNDSVNAYQDRLTQIKHDMQLRFDLNQSRVDNLQQQIQDMVRNGTGNESDLNFLKQQLMEATGTMDAYRKVLSNIIPPVELAFTSATNLVQSSMNALSGQTIFNGNGTVNTITDFTNFSKDNLPEWDSQWFNTEMGRIKTSIGNMQEGAANNALIADGNYDSISKEAQAQMGVNLVDEEVKMLRYQRMYEANAAVIKTQDAMIGTLLNIFS